MAADWGGDGVGAAYADGVVHEAHGGNRIELVEHVRRGRSRRSRFLR